jgi:nickel-dependent lactate racemase
VDVQLAYGSTGLTVSLPDTTEVVVPEPRPGVRDPLATLLAALREPVAGPRVRDLARPGQRVAVSACDVTRPQPRAVMLRALLAELDGIVEPADVTILVATGTHRRSSPAELEAMFGADLVRQVEIVDHDARDAGSLVDLGRAGDVPVRLNRRWVEADLRITTGFVEPHFFAGFSGGPKMVAPGLAGLETVLALHDARRIGDPRATWGICEGNPVHDDIRAVAALAPPHLALDVLLNARQEITHAFAGELFAMHAAAREVARDTAMRRVDRPFDVVITTNAGYPLDQNLYQSIKGISAAAEIVADGGLIVCAAECRDGLPDHGEYARLLAAGTSIRDVRRRIEAAAVTIPDQWQVQIQARVQERVRVLVHAAALTPEQLRAAHLEPAADIEATVADAIRGRPDLRVCALPEGPQTIAYVA